LQETWQKAAVQFIANLDLKFAA